MELTRRYPVRPLAKLPDLLRGHIIDEIIFAVDGRRLGGLEEVFASYGDEEGVKARVAVDFFVHVNGQVSLGRLGPSPLLALFGDAWR